ncbi:MAG: hypothetical protein JOY59_02045 [Candidatus Eremiobacteraeota bacterium]|nr:hypothetical protein [Candidatus Eremiobacteraeota bacterium]
MQTRRTALAAQAAYYLVTGVWPLISMHSFEAVTGPKTDRWLVKMVGHLAATIGATLAIGAQKEEPDAQTLFLAVVSAFCFGSVGAVYALNGTISKIYLADAVVEAALIAALLRG